MSDEQTAPAATDAKGDVAKLLMWVGGIVGAIIILAFMVGGGGNSSHTMAEIEACGSKSPTELRAMFGEPPQVVYQRDSYDVRGEMKWIWRPVSVYDAASGITSNQIVHADVSPSAGRTWECGTGL